MNNLENLERLREQSVKTTAELDAKIAAFRKPPEKFQVGVKAAIKAEVVRINRGEGELTHYVTFGDNDLCWVRESDLLPATPTPTVTRERIQVALHSAGIVHLCRKHGVDFGSVTRAMETCLGAVPEPPKPTVTREKIEAALRGYVNCWFCAGDATTELTTEQVACHLAEALGAVPEPPRCPTCNWPLYDSIEKGCVPGNCSMRPLPKPAVPESSKPAVSRDRIQAALEKIGHVGSFPETLADKLATALGAVSEPSKQVGGSDVCETCAAHCVVLDDQDREIARLKAKLKSAPIVSREAILAALRASRVRGIVIENLLSWESPEWLATVLAEKLGVKGDT